jgi:hypothetical protein
MQYKTISKVIRVLKGSAICDRHCITNIKYITHDSCVAMCSVYLERVEDDIIMASKTHMCHWSMYTSDTNLTVIRM